MADYLQRAIELAPELVQHRRTIHQNAEVGLDLPDTVRYVWDRLIEMGYEPKKVGGGICATVGKPGKVFLLRADMDALPMEEESGLPFASQRPGAAHCCGHDLHTAMLLGAAKLLKERESELQGTVKLMFQPGEECMTGAKSMLAAGLLEGPHVDAGMAIHVNSTVPVGALLVTHGPMAASSDIFTVRVTGKGCHGGRPCDGVDPTSIICHIHTALQEIQARELWPGDIGVLTVGSLHAGSASNVIPNEAEMTGTIRTFDTKVQETICRRLVEISEGIAATFRGSATVEFAPGKAIPMICDDAVANDVNDALLRLFPEKQVHLFSKHFPGSEDFSYITNEIPATFVALGASIGPDVKYGQHHPKVQFNEKCLPVGAAAYAQAATVWLDKHSTDAKA